VSIQQLLRQGIAKGSHQIAELERLANKASNFGSTHGRRQGFLALVKMIFGAG
jgi:hypothetical protein